MSESVYRWLAGLVGFSVIFGFFLSYAWYCILCAWAGTKRKLKFSMLFKKLSEETGHVTGLLERVFFTVAIATGMGGTAIAMIAWTVMKDSKLWLLFKGEKEDQGYVSLFSSFGSMLIAIVGAEICKGNLSL